MTLSSKSGCASNARVNPSLNRTVLSCSGDCAFCRLLGLSGDRELRLVGEVVRLGTWKAEFGAGEVGALEMVSWKSSSSSEDEGGPWLAFEGERGGAIEVVVVVYVYS